MPDNVFKELEQFFTDYNRIEGKEFKALKKLEAKEAKELVGA